MCKRCGRELPVSEFGKHARTKDGLQHYCRECLGKLMRSSRSKKKDAVQDDDTESAPASLANYTDHELAKELQRRGFRGLVSRKVDITI